MDFFEVEVIYYEFGKFEKKKQNCSFISKESALARAEQLTKCEDFCSCVVYSNTTGEVIYHKE